MKKILILLTIFICVANTINAQWQQTKGPYGGLIDCIATDGTNIFVGTGSGIILSTDNGNSWAPVNNGLTSLSIASIAISGTKIFVGTYDGIFLSNNNGSSWTSVTNQIKNVSSLIVSGTNIFAGTRGNGVFLSTNNGNSWTAVNNGMTNT